MTESRLQRWPRAVILLGVVYVVIGLTFGSLAGWASSNQMRSTWRVLAWLISALAFLAHIWYEQFRLRSSRITTAFHAALAVALGTLVLAAAAIIHGQAVGASHQSRRILALVLWPALASVPAFLAALVAAAVMGVRRRGPT